MRYFGKIKSEKRRASEDKTRNPQSPDGVLRQNGRAKSDKTRRRFTAKSAHGKRQKPTAENDNFRRRNPTKNYCKKSTKNYGIIRYFFAADSDKISPAYSDKNRDMRGCFIVNFQRIKVRYQPTCRRPRLFLRSKKR